ncbi:hypothetical protein IT568_11640 [bacterium]|nr:hypothetical protein [bacterium]
MLTLNKILFLSFVVTVFACNDDENSTTTTEVPTEVTEIEGSTLTSTSTKTVLEMEAVPSTSTDENVTAAIAQAKSVTETFGVVLDNYPNESGLPSIVKETLELTKIAKDTTIFRDLNGVTVTLKLLDKTTKFQAIATVKGVSTTTGSTFNGEKFYDCTTLKNRRGGFMDYNFGIWFDIFGDTTQVQKDGKYLANYKIEPSGKLTLFYSSETTHTLNNQNAEFDYKGKIILNADKSGSSEIDYNVVNFQGQHFENKTCFEWNASGNKTECN